jgi:hypothetical protein
MATEPLPADDRVPPTPGPWAIMDESDDNGGHLTVFAPHWHVIAYVSMGWGPEINASQQANARLIAAAPDLLEALNDLGLWLLKSKAADAELRGEQRIPCFLQLEWVAKALAAVQKAQGTT